MLLLVATTTTLPVQRGEQFEILRAFITVTNDNDCEGY